MNEKIELLKSEFNQERVLRLLAWIGGIAVSTIWLFLLAVSIFSENADPRLEWSLEGILLILLILSSVAGLLLSLKNTAAGGRMLVISSLFLSIFAYFAAGHNRLFAVACSGLPFLLVGLLLLQSVPPELRAE